MTRALDMRDGKPGYAVVEVGHEWIHFYNKNIGEAAVPKFAFAVNTSHKPLADNKSGEWTSPEGWEVTRLWADSASVFTRLGFDKDNVYFGNSLGQARAVGKGDGRLRWSIPTGASLFSRPVVTAPGKVAVPTATGIMFVTADGKPVKTLNS